MLAGYLVHQLNWSGYIEHSWASWLAILGLLLNDSVNPWAKKIPANELMVSNKEKVKGFCIGLIWFGLGWVFFSFYPVQLADETILTGSACYQNGREGKKIEEWEVLMKLIYTS